MRETINIHVILITIIALRLSLHYFLSILKFAIIEANAESLSITHLFIRSWL